MIIFCLSKTYMKGYPKKYRNIKEMPKEDQNITWDISVVAKTPEIRNRSMYM